VLRAPSLIRRTLAWLHRLLAPCFRSSPGDVQGAVEVDSTLTVETASGEVHVSSAPPAVRVTDTRPRLRVTLAVREVTPELLSRTLAGAGIGGATGLRPAADPGRRA